MRLHPAFLEYKFIVVSLPGGSLFLDFSPCPLEGEANDKVAHVEIAVRLARALRAPALVVYGGGRAIISLHERRIDLVGRSDFFGPPDTETVLRLFESELASGILRGLTVSSERLVRSAARETRLNAEQIDWYAALFAHSAA